MHPDWYSSLSTDLQARLYVDYMMCHESKKDADTKGTQAKLERIQQWKKANE